MAGKIITDIIEVNTIIADSVLMQDSNGTVYLSVSNGVLSIFNFDAPNTKYSNSSGSANDAVYFGGQLPTFYVSNTSFTSHTSNTSNPHGVTASEIGLENVTNESKTTMFTSPTLTGVPLAPTADANTNTTQIATTEFVQTIIGNINTILSSI